MSQFTQQEQGTGTQEAHMQAVWSRGMGLGFESWLCLLPAKRHLQIPPCLPTKYRTSSLLTFLSSLEMIY